MGMVSGTKRIIIFCAGVVILCLLIYHKDISDIFTGYWKFRTLCDMEGGARYYEPVEKNVGWMIAKIHDRHENPDDFPFFFNPAFFRYKDINGDEFDVIEAPQSIYNNPPHLRYIITPADNSKKIRYLYKRTSEDLFFQDKRFRKGVHKIIDLEKRSEVARYTSYLYRWRLSYWLFIPPSYGKKCPNFSFVQYSNFPNEIYNKNINTKRWLNE